MMSLLRPWPALVFTAIVFTASTSAVGRTPHVHLTAEQLEAKRTAAAAEREVQLRSSKLAIDNDCKPSMLMRARLSTSLSVEERLAFWRGQHYAIINRVQAARNAAFDQKTITDADNAIFAIEQRRDDELDRRSGVVQKKLASDDARAMAAIDRESATFDREMSAATARWATRCHVVVDREIASAQSTP